MKPNESVKQPSSSRKFYYASSYHLPGIVGGGAEVAKAVIPRIEAATGHVCTAKWPTDFRHGEPWFAAQAAETDFKSVHEADYLLFLPLTKTSRGTHVELGMALARGIPVYGFRFASGDDGTAFDAMCQPLPDFVEAIITEELLRVREAHRGEEPTMPKPMPKVA